MRRTLRRVHVWLGWIVGVPLLFWTVSGLWMVARPIDEVRGTALKRAAVPIDVASVTALPVGVGPVTSLQLAMLPRGPVWQAKFADGHAERFDARTGVRLPPVAVGEAREIANRNYAGASGLDRVTHFTADHAPLDLRQPRPSWQVHFADQKNMYVEADTGAVLALRTDQWRLFDWMWGLHIMDLGEREDTSHPVLIVSAALTLATVVLALILLPLSSKRRRLRKDR
jgi:hypothetical protein